MKKGTAMTESNLNRDLFAKNINEKYEVTSAAEMTLIVPSHPFLLDTVKNGLAEIGRQVVENLIGFDSRFAPCKKFELEGDQIREMKKILEDIIKEDEDATLEDKAFVGLKLVTVWRFLHGFAVCIDKIDNVMDEEMLKMHEGSPIADMIKACSNLPEYQESDSERKKRLRKVAIGCACAHESYEIAEKLKTASSIAEFRSLLSDIDTQGTESGLLEATVAMMVGVD